MAFCALIVDDSPVMRGVIRRVMKLAGFDISGCIEAGNGEEALVRLRERQVDVVITDVNMPRMNGEELLRRMQDEGLLRTTPALVVSTDATEQRLHKMMAIGASGYVTKPFSPETLRMKLERVLENRSRDE
jgi:two-component system chemotaxis response regulator CheY